MAKAEEELRALLREVERDLGANHPAAAYPLAHLGDICSTNRQAEAENCYKCAIEIWERHEPNSYRIAQPLNNLGVLYAAQGKFAEAEPLMERALQVREENGGEYPGLCPVLDNLSYVYHMQGKEDQAEAAKQRLEGLISKFDSYPRRFDGWEHSENLSYVDFGKDPWSESKAMYMKFLMKKEEQNLKNAQSAGNWEQMKQRMQGAFSVLIGDSVAIGHEKMEELSYAKFLQDDIALEYLEDEEHPRERDEKTRQIDIEEPER